MSELRCHKCSAWLGESVEPLEFHGVVKQPKDREMVDVPRDTRRCKGCGWVNIFRPAKANWRAMETKKAG